MKEWGAWLGEKVGRLKMKHGRGFRLGAFEALEFLGGGDSQKMAVLAHWPSLQFAICNSRQTSSISSD
jgi:hypothetical protein